MADKAVIHIPVINKDVPQGPAMLIAGAIVIVLVLLRGQNNGSSGELPPSNGLEDESGYLPVTSGAIAGSPNPTPSAPGTRSGGSRTVKQIQSSSDWLRLVTIDDYLAGKELPDQKQIPNFVQKQLQGKSRADIQATHDRLVQKLLASGATADMLAGL